MFMSWPSLIIFHIIGYTVTFSLAIGGYFCITDEESSNYLLATLPPETLRNKGPRTPAMFLDINSSILQFGILYTIILLFISIALGFFMAIHIILYLRKNVSSFTEKTYKMHLQLTVVLIVQQITPILCIILPLIITVLIGIVNSGDIQISKAVLSIILTVATFYPATNALICIIFITPYWNFTKGWILWIFFKMKILKQEADEQKVVVIPTNVFSVTYVG